MKNLSLLGWGSKLHKKYRLFLSIIFVLVLVISVFVFYSKKTDKTSNQNKMQQTDIANIDQVREGLKKSEEDLLKNKQYDKYQINKLVLADMYVNQNNYVESKKMLEDVVKNVPQSQVKSSVFSLLARISHDNNDKENYKKYIVKTVDSLKREGGQEVTIKNWETVLGGIK